MGITTTYQIEILLANATSIYWLFSYWADFVYYTDVLGLGVTPQMQLTVGHLTCRNVSVLCWMG